MLLRHTPKEVSERSALRINPAKTCQPIGAMYAALGINGCLPHSHGSQGCCSYPRSMLTRHFKEPVMASTSSFTEGASVFGGQANLMQAIDNIFSLYDPEVIAVHTTCLSETIGDDVSQIISRARDEGKIPEGKFVFHASTPSYVGSHVTGFANMVKAMVDYFAEPGQKKSDGALLNIIPGFVEPSDMIEIRRIAGVLGIEALLLPDTSGVLDGPLTGHFEMYPKGGISTADLKRIGGAAATIALGTFSSLPAAKALDAKCDVPYDQLDLPIGLLATDRFIDAMRIRAGVTVPEEIARERGQLIDVISDWHQYLYNKKVAIAGDPDHVIALTEFCLSAGMKPVHIVTGTPGKDFEKRMEPLVKDLPYKVNYRSASDLFLLHQWIKNEPVDLLIGNSHLKYISRDQDIPLVRAGFPIVDRLGHQYFPIVGYKGAIMLLQKTVNAFLDRADRDAPEERFEFVM